MKVSLVILMIAISLCFAQAEKGLDISTPVGDVLCLKQQGISFFIVKAYSLIYWDMVDINVVTSLQQIQQTKVRADIYHTPVDGIQPQLQAQTVLKGIKSDLYEKVWIDIGDQSNRVYYISGLCDFILTLAATYQKAGKTVGIHASSTSFQNLRLTSCSKLSQFPLWYQSYSNSNDPAYNAQDWKRNQFGGWKNPNITQIYEPYGPTCNTHSNLNFM